MTPFVATDLKADEGLRLKAYPDPKTGADPWTIGFGHTGLDVHPALVWTVEQAEAALQADIAKVCVQLDAKLPWWRSLSDPRQDVLVEMVFNLGLAGLLEFQHMLAAAKVGAFNIAANEMLTNAPDVPTQWAKDVGPHRSGRLAAQMRTGLHAGTSAPAPKNLADASTDLHGLL